MKLTDQDKAELSKRIINDFLKQHRELGYRFTNDLNQLANLMVSMEQNYAHIAIDFCLQFLDEHDLIAKEKSIG